MRAVITNGDNTVHCADVREPSLGPYDSLVKIRSCLFCNTTDRHIIERSFDFGLSYPCILGHESIGEIIETGPHVKNFQTGDRVTRPYAIYPDEKLDHLGSGWGGFAELGKIRDVQAMIEDGALRPSAVPGYFKYMQKIPKEVPLAEAAMLTPLKEIYSSTIQIPEIRGRSFLIAGAGIAGMLFAHFLHLRGAAKIAIAARRAEACEFAMAETPATIARPLPDFRNEYYDAAIDTTGSADIVRAIISDRLAPEGSFFSYAIYPQNHEGKLLSNIPRIDPQEAEAHEAVCQLLAAGILKTVHWIGKSFSPDEAEEAWRSVTNKESLKTAIVFDS